MPKQRMLENSLNHGVGLMKINLKRRNTITHHSIPPPPYIQPKRPATETSTVCGDYLGAYSKFIEQNVTKSVQTAQASCDLEKSFDQQIKKNIENFMMKNANAADVARPEKTYCHLTRIQNSDHLSRYEKPNISMSQLSTLPLSSNIKSIRPIYNNKSTNNQSPLILNSSLNALAAPISTPGNSPSIPSTPPTLLNCSAQNMAKVTAKRKPIASPPINCNEQLLSNLVKREMLSKYSTPSTTCTTGTDGHNNIQLLYPSHTKFDQIHAINPPQAHAQTTIQHGQFQQRSKDLKSQHHELHQTHKKPSTAQLHKVPQSQQKYIINTAKQPTELYTYPRNKIKAAESSQTSAAYKVSASQDKTLLSEPSAPILELNTSISQAFIYNQILNLKSNLLQSRLLGVSSEDN